MKKGVDEQQDDSGTLPRSIPMSDEMSELLNSHMDGLADELGRDLTPDDKLFPNDQLEQMEHGIVQAMQASGVDPAIIYAFEHTGVLVGEDNQHLISDSDLAKWHDAIAEYRALQGADPELVPSARFLDTDNAIAHCWSCGQEIPTTAQRCPHCEADIEELPSLEEQASVMKILEQMGPEFMKEIENVFAESSDGEDFVNRIMVGPCPKCDSDNTSDCENEPEIEDPCIGRCIDCGQHWCCDCEELFETAKAAAAHDCPVWEAMEDELEGI